MKAQLARIDAPNNYQVSSASKPRSQHLQNSLHSIKQIPNVTPVAFSQHFCSINKYNKLIVSILAENKIFSTNCSILDHKFMSHQAIYSLQT